MTGGVVGEAGAVGAAGKAGEGVVGPGDVGAGTGMVLGAVCACPLIEVARSRPQARRECRTKRMMHNYNMRYTPASIYFRLQSDDSANATAIAL